jgi:hypothetical protein
MKLITEQEEFSDNCGGRAYMYGFEQDSSGPDLLIQVHIHMTSILDAAHVTSLA